MIVSPNFPFDRYYDSIKIAYPVRRRDVGNARLRWFAVVDSPASEPKIRFLRRPGELGVLSVSSPVRQTRVIRLYIIYARAFPRDKLNRFPIDRTRTVFI